MITLKQLYLRAFRSFEDFNVIDFPTNGFVLIDGANKDTGGSSGSGKTSIVEAVAFALGYARLPATELQNRNSDLTLQVKLTVGSPQGDIEIARGKMAYVKYLNSGQLIQGAKPMEEELRKILGLPTDLIEALTYRPQRSFGRFISMTDSEKKEFLTNCLPELEEIETISEQARQEFELKETKITELKEKLRALEAELARHQQNDPAVQLIPVEISFIETQIEIAQADIQNKLLAQETAGSQLGSAENLANDFIKRYESELTVEAGPSRTQANELLNRLRGDMLEAEAQRAAARDGILKIEATHRAEIETYDVSVRTARRGLQDLTTAYSKKTSILDSLARIEGELQVLRTSVCPTCRREWLQAEQKAIALIVEQDALKQKLTLLDEIGTRIKTAEAEIATLEQSRAALVKDGPQKAALTEYLGTLDRTFSDLTSKIAECNLVLMEIAQTIRTQIQEKRQEQQSGIALLESESKQRILEYNMAQSQLLALTNQLVAAQQRNREIQSQIQKYRQTLREVQDLIAAKQTELPELEQQLQLERSVHAALGRTGYLGSIFDEILVEIGQEVTEVLARVPNVSSVSLRFDSASQTKTGTTKRSIVPVVTKDGVPASYASLSGGQQSSVELAVDLAIGNVIGRRTGRTPGWIVLDEAMDGMDLPAKESCMEILKRYATDRLIMIVDHSSELKEAFSKIITVIMKSGTSTVEL